MDRDDVVERGDAALQALLALVAEHTDRESSAPAIHRSPFAALRWRIAHGTDIEEPGLPAHPHQSSDSQVHDQMTLEFAC